MGKRKLSDIDTDSPIFRTTICFRGRARELMLVIGNNKSHIVNNIINDAMADGSIVELLKKIIQPRKVDELIEKFNLSNQGGQSQKSVAKSETIQNQNDENNNQMRTERIKIGQINKNKDGNNGFDY